MNGFVAWTLVIGVVTALAVIVIAATLVFDHGVRRGWWQEDWT